MESSSVLNNKFYDDNCFRELEAKLTSSAEREKRLARLKRKELFKEPEKPNVKSAAISSPSETSEEDEKFKLEFEELKNVIDETPELDFLKQRVSGLDSSRVDYPSIIALYRMSLRTLKEQYAKLKKESEEAVVDDKKIIEMERHFTEKERENFVLRETVTQKERKLKESIDRYDRLQVDFNNFRGRTSSDAVNKASKEFEDVILKILPVIDDFERALNSSKVVSESDQSVLKGIEMVIEQFYNVLKQIGIEVVDAQGKPFDPKLHEAIMVEVNEELPEDTITEVISNGYTFNSKLLKPVTVKVSKKSN